MWEICVDGNLKMDFLENYKLWVKFVKDEFVGSDGGCLGKLIYFDFDLIMVGVIKVRFEKFGLEIKYY